MQQFPAELVSISPAAQNEWDIAIQSAEYEYETEFDGEYYAHILTDGDLIISTESSDGCAVSVRVRGKHWQPVYTA